MKKLLVLLAAMARAYALACPMLVEVFSDPESVSDNEGEFIEIRLEEEDRETFSNDSLIIQMDGRKAIRIAYPDSKRLVLIHDSLGCPSSLDSSWKNGISCGLLGSLSLPNSRETSWKVQVGACIDSIVVPKPKEGVSLQRVLLTDEWSFSNPTFGTANSEFEEVPEDCSISGILDSVAGILDSVGSFGWNYTFFTSGCDSTTISLTAVCLRNGKTLHDSAMVFGSYHLSNLPKDLWIRAELPNDEVPSNNVLDTILTQDLGFPLSITEIHPCPLEPEPEWVEVYNGARVSLPLSKFHFCNRGGAWGKSNDNTLNDSISPYETIVLTKDTAALRDVFGFRDVRLRQVAFGYLNNTAGCISICNGETIVDSVCWEKGTVECPTGFNPQTGNSENTPGFVRASSFSMHINNAKSSSTSAPFEYRLSSRLVRLDGNPLRVYLNNSTSVLVCLLDSAGRERYRLNVPPQSNAWWNIPIGGISVGVAYISLSAGSFENVVGILVRP